jgi:hypothetical protein
MLALQTSSSWRPKVPIIYSMMGWKDENPAPARAAYRSRLGLAVVLVALGLPTCGRESGSEETSSEQPVDQTEAVTSVATATSTATATASSTAASMVTPPAYPRPDRLCGKPGFAYLLSVYFYPQCSKCHGGNDIAGADPDVSWPRMRTFDDQKVIGVVLSGQFCAGACRLEEGDAILADIRAWQVEKDGCP